MALNNPGNIRYNPDFRGVTGKDSRGFANFDTRDNGIRAIWVLLNTYFDKYNLKTIRQILSRYDPEPGPVLETYIKNVQTWTGINQYTVLDKKDLILLVPAITRQESQTLITVADVERAISQGQTPVEMLASSNPIPLILGAAFLLWIWTQKK
jgi:hypothetical protein